MPAPIASNPGGAPGPATTPSPAPSSAASSGNLVYTTYFDGQTAKILAFPTGTGGNIAPVKTITSAQASLWAPSGLAFDSTGALYVLNENTPGENALSVSVFARGSNGNVTPIRQIAGSTAFPSAYVLNGLTLDAGGNLYVAEDNATNPSPGCGNQDSCGVVAIFAPNANGNVAPVRTISWSSCTHAESVAVAPSGAISISCWVQTSSAQYGEIGTFAANAAGNASPASVITGSSTGLTYAGAMALSPSGSLLVLPIYKFQSISTLLGFPQGASGNTAPSIEIDGSRTDLSAANIAVDSTGTIYAIDSSTSQSSNPPTPTVWITEYAANANGNIAPTYVISGSNTGLGCGTGTAFCGGAIAVGPP